MIGNLRVPSLITVNLLGQATTQPGKFIKDLLHTHLVLDPWNPAVIRDVSFFIQGYSKQNHAMPSLRDTMILRLDNEPAWIYLIDILSRSKGLTRDQ
ncbi:hypothetical protein D3C77_568270 [compost metagenome]